MQQIRNKLDPREQREKNKSNLQESAKSLCQLTLGAALEYLNRKHEVHQPEKANRGQLWTVWFNAWKYDTSEQVWAGLVDAIVSQISGRLPPTDRELFLLRLQLARIDDGIVRRKIYDRVVTIWWNKVRNWFLLGVGAIATALGLHHVTADATLPPFLQHLISASPVAASAGLAFYLFLTYGSSRRETHSEPASFSLAQYLKVPDYDHALGTIHHIHLDLLRVLSLTPRDEETSGPSPIVIFIDDLDRCSPSKVASVVEGVNMFLASEDYRCMFVIGMDPQMIAAALEEAHAKVRDQLPSYENTVPLGWRFMDKFIQLPFTIPPSDKDRLKSYVDWLAAPEQRDATLAADERAPVAQVTPITPIVQRSQRKTDIALSPVEEPEPSKQAQAEILFKESRDVGIIIREAAGNTSGNPREIKRLANLARLYLGLRNSKRRHSSTWISPNLGQYARWIALTLRWPDMMRWLQWGADECSWSTVQASLSLQERRLHVLQDTALTSTTAEMWKVAVVGTLNVPCDKPSDWVRDTKLFEFFRAEAELPQHERLSTAVARGFW